ncbi:MAG: hypothetical protein ACQER6_00520 [Pseudomonadota bacterium]
MSRDIEAAVVVSDGLDEPLDRLPGPLLDPAGMDRGIAVILEALVVRGAHHVDHTVDGDLAVADRAFRRELHASHQRLGDHVIAAHATQIRGIDTLEHGIERLAEPGKPLARESDGLVEIALVVDAKAEGRGIATYRLDPERKIDADLAERIVREGIHRAERGREFGQDTSLFQAPPVLVGTAKHGIQGWRGKSEALAENGADRRDREVPVADDRVDRPVERIQDSLSLVDHDIHVTIDTHLLALQQTVKAEPFPVGNHLEVAKMHRVQPDDEDIATSAGSAGHDATPTAG